MDSTRKPIVELIEQFKRDHASVFWEDAEHCSCFPAHGDGDVCLPDLPDAIIMLALNAHSLGFQAGAARASRGTKRAAKP